MISNVIDERVAADRTMRREARRRDLEIVLQGIYGPIGNIGELSLTELEGMMVRYRRIAARRLTGD